MPDLADTVIVVAVLQGAVLAVVLARRRTNVLANRILAALVTAVASMLLLGFLERQIAWRGHPHLQVGLRGGGRLGNLELFASAGLQATQHLDPGLPPYYATVGSAYAF